MKTRFLTTAAVAILSSALVFATTELSAQSSTRRGSTGGNKETSIKAGGNRNADTPPKSTTTGSSGRNYNDHINNINLGNNDRPGGNNRSGGKPNGNDNKNKPNNNDNKNRPGNYGSSNDKPNNHGNDNYHGNRGDVNPPKATPPKANPPKANPPREPNRYNPPRYDRHDPNRYLGYNPFRDGRIIHRPNPYAPEYDFDIRFSTRPSASIKIRFGGLTLYFSSGVWYNYSNGYYTVHRPPIGTIIPYKNISGNLYYVDFEVPMDYGTTYYVDSYANFYMAVRNFRTYGSVESLQVVNAPVGAILYDLPSDYQEIEYNGRIYYLVGNSVFDYVYSTANSWYFRCIGLYQ